MSNLVITVVVQGSCSGVLAEVGSLGNPNRLLQFKGPEGGGQTTRHTEVGSCLTLDGDPGGYQAPSV